MGFHINAYKLKDPTKFPELIQKWKIKGRENIKAKLFELYESMMKPDVIKDNDWYKEYIKKGHSEFSASVEAAYNTITSEYKKASASKMRDFFDFDVSIAFRFFEGNVYVSPHCDMYMHSVLDFFEDDPELVDFHYQNRTDRDEDITDEDWEERRRVWNAMIDSGEIENALMLNICSQENFYLINPYLDILKERHEQIQKEKKKKP